MIGVDLVNTPEAVTTFRQGIGIEVTTTETGVGTEVVSRVHMLNRDRIAVTGTRDRSIVAREYPAEGDLTRLAQVAGMAISCTELGQQELRAFGYNIDLVCEPGAGLLAIQYLSDRLFIPDLLQDGGWELVGGAGRLFFEKDGRTWQARLEPRLNDETTSKIFLSLNLHSAGAHITCPTEAEITESLQLLWGEAYNFVAEIDRSGSNK